MKTKKKKKKASGERKTNKTKAQTHLQGQLHVVAAQEQGGDLHVRSVRRRQVHVHVGGSGVGLDDDLVAPGGLGGHLRVEDHTGCAWGGGGAPS